MNRITDSLTSPEQQATGHNTTVVRNEELESERERQRLRHERRALMMAVPRRDQSPLGAASTADGLTLSHEPTTTYSDSIAEGYASNENANANAGNSNDESGKKRATPSVYSFHSSRDLSQFIKEVHGRSFNTLNEAYILPSDESEWGRLDKQHTALLLAMGGLSPSQDIVDALLVPDDNEQKRVMDIGCGTGVWCIEMSKRYPHVSILGIDLSPTPIDQSLLPSNLSFEIDDVNEGLEHYHSQFDVIHMRSVMAGIKDIDKTVNDVMSCLRPGGLLIMICADTRVYGEDRTTAAKIPDTKSEGPNSEGSWFAKIIWETSTANSVAGASWERAQVLVDHGLWDHPLADPQTAVSGSAYLPIGPWPKLSTRAIADKVGFVGALMRQVLMNVHRAYHATLLKYGMDQETLNEWSEKIDDELLNMRVKTWIRFRLCWARRRLDEKSPAPPLPEIPPQFNQALSEETSDTDNEPQNQDGNNGRSSRNRYPYPFFYLHHTAEEAAHHTKLRNDAARSLPESELLKAWEKKQLTANETFTGTDGDGVEDGSGIGGSSTKISSPGN